MDTRSLLEEFAGRFVVTPFRERFIHEALNKPGKLHERICHSIEEVFPSRYRHGGLPFKDGDRVFPIVGTDHDGAAECDWKDISIFEGAGCGILVASADLLHFYSETEAGP